MTIREFFKRLGINLEDEIEDTNSEASKINEVGSENEVKESVDDTQKDENNNIEEEVKEKMALRIPTYDSVTGLFDLESTDNEELKALLKSVNESVINKNNQSLIDKAVGDKLGSVKLHKGISADFVRKNLDLSGVSVKDGKVVGVEEAFTALQKEQAGLFVASKQESSPLLEGYNPIKSNSYDISGLSITDAMNMQEQGL